MSLNPNNFSYQQLKTLAVIENSEGSPNKTHLKEENTMSGEPD